jgi:hypothetical protein
MDISQVLEWLSGSAVAARIAAVLAHRQQLFANAELRRLLGELTRFR